MNKTIKREYPDIDAVVAAAVIALEDQIVIRGVDDAERGTFYYLRLDASDVTQFDMTDDVAVAQLTDEQKDALTAMFAARDAKQLKQWDGLLSYDGSWNSSGLSGDRDEAYSLLAEYIAHQKALYPDLDIVDGGLN